MSAAIASLAPRDVLADGKALLFAGDPAAAGRLFQSAAEADPADFEARFWLYSALAAQGDEEGAATALSDARTLMGVAAMRTLDMDVVELSRSPERAAAEARRLYGMHLVGAASVAYGMAVSGGDHRPETLVSFGLSLMHQGRIEESIQVFRAATELYQGPGLHQFLLLPHLYAENGPARHAVEARRWAELYAPAGPVVPFANPPAVGRRLKIGYIAPSFLRVQARQFMRPLFDNHDPAGVQVFAFPQEAEDLGAGVTAIPIGHLDDAAAAALIRSQGIDILIDCWGHTAGSRLPVMALKPAPVQAGFINFIQTTGLPQVDYILHADSAPTPAEGLYTEAIQHIGPMFNVFQPDDRRLDPVATPALSTGRITFGSFNHPAKLSESVVETWAAVLCGAPTSRLLLKYGYFVDPVLQRATQARFAARGVAPERIEFEGETKGEAYYAAFRTVDLMLDTWPAPGSTTTLEALSNGVPVLSLSDPAIHALNAPYVRSFLEASGLPELVVASREDFVARALELAADPVRLDALRARVRPGFESGACCDGAAFARGLEAAFAEMFDAWRVRAAAAA